jgi:hypothetical protein
MRHNPALGIMTKLMQRGRKIMLAAGEGLLGRQSDEILGRNVAGPIAANPNISLGGVDEEHRGILSQFRLGDWDRFEG